MNLSVGELRMRVGDDGTSEVSRWKERRGSAERALPAFYIIGPGRAPIRRLRLGCCLKAAIEVVREVALVLEADAQTDEAVADAERAPRRRPGRSRAS